MVMEIKKKVNVTSKQEFVIVRIILKVNTVNDVGQIIPVIQKMESSAITSVSPEDSLGILMAKESVLFNHTFLLGVELQQENVSGL